VGKGTQLPVGKVLVGEEPAMSPEIATEATNAAIFFAYFLGPVLVLPALDRCCRKPTKTDKLS